MAAEVKLARAPRCCHCALQPVVLEKHPWEVIEKLQGNKWVHVKQVRCS